MNGTMAERLFVQNCVMNKYDQSLNIVDQIIVGPIVTTLCVTSDAYCGICRNGENQLQLTKLDDLRDYFVCLKTKVDKEFIYNLTTEYFIRYSLLYHRDDGIQRDIKNPSKANQPRVNATTVASAESFWEIKPGLVPIEQSPVNYPLESRGQRKALQPYNVGPTPVKPRKIAQQPLPKPPKAPTASELKNNKPNQKKDTKKKETKKKETKAATNRKMKDLDPLLSNLEAVVSEQLESVLGKRVFPLLSTPLPAVIPPESSSTSTSSKDMIAHLRTQNQIDKADREAQANKEYEHIKEAVDRHETFRNYEHQRSMEVLDKVVSLSHHQQLLVSPADRAAPFSNKKSSEIMPSQTLPRELFPYEKKQYISKSLLGNEDPDNDLSFPWVIDQSLKVLGAESLSEKCAAVEATITKINIIYNYVKALADTT